MSRYLIHEETHFDVPKNIQKQPNGVIRFVVTLQEADKKNRNRRVYPKRVLNEAINDPRIQDLLNRNALFCEFGHPSDPSIERQSKIIRENMCALIKKFFWESNNLKAIVETTATDAGRDLRDLILENNFVPGWSLRATGQTTTDNYGDVIVESPLTMFAYDCVLFPSNSGAIMEKLCEDTKIIASKNTVLFEDAVLYEIPKSKDSTILKEELDFSATYFKKVKPISSYYKYDERDAVVKQEGNVVVLESADYIKKVDVDDFYKKEIAYKIAKLFGNK